MDGSIEETIVEITREVLIETENGIVYIDRNWLSGQSFETFDKDNLFRYLRDTVDFKQTKVKVWNKIHDTPRLMAFHGNDEVKYHRYSNIKHIVNNWNNTTLELKERICDELGTPFNSSIIQLYRDRYDYIGYHSDKEITSDFNNIVVGLSLGGTRRFYFKDKETREVIKTEVNHGDLLVMSGDIQEKYKHSIPKQVGVSPRISITYRILRDYL